MNLRPLFIVIIIVFGLSILYGYWRSIVPYYPLILKNAGHTYVEIGQIMFYQNTLFMAVSYGGSLVLLIASYYSGKRYRITGTSALLLLFLLIVTILIGGLIGYAITQYEYPQYPILNVNFIFDILSDMGNRIVWVFLGVLAGNYKRELKRKIVTSEEKKTNSNPSA